MGDSDKPTIDPDKSEHQVVLLSGWHPSQGSEDKAVARADEAIDKAVVEAGGKVLPFDPKKPHKRKTAK